MTTPHPVHDWFKKEIFPWLVGGSIIRGLFLQFIVLFLFSCLVTFSPWNPIRWVSHNIWTFLSPTSWIYDALIFGSFAAVSWLQAHHIRMTIHMSGSRMRDLKNFVSSSNLTSLAMHFIAISLIVECLLRLFSGSNRNLLAPCGENSSATCLNSNHLFIVSSGGFLGIFLWFEYYFRNGNVIDFPLILESGNAQLSGEAKDILKKSFLSVVYSIKWFYLIYFSLGFKIEDLLSTKLGLPLQRSSVDISWSNLILDQFEILFTVLILLTALSFCIRIAKKVMFINLTKPIAFPNEDYMIEAMSDGTSLLSHQACMYFSHFATKSKEMRSLFFALSQPGHHPHQWAKLNMCCLKNIDSFLRQLNEGSQALRASHHAKNLEEEVRPQSNVNAGNLKFKEIEKSPNTFALVAMALIERFQKISFLTSPPDLALRLAFAQSQKIIWIVDGFSHLISASVVEDPYGIVQKDVGEILVALFTLQQSVDRQKVLPPTSMKRGRVETRDQQLKQELRSSIKTAIYRIICAYGDSILEIPIPQEHRKRVLNYLHFKEA